jgi:FkbM family methyltransferase
MSSVLSKYAYYAFSLYELLTGFEDPAQTLALFTRRGQSNIKIIRLRKSGLQFKVRSAMDVWSIKETFLDRFYERCGFAVQPGWTVVDIGAGLGEYTLFAAQAPRTRVFGFEPFPTSFELLRANAALNKLENIQAFDEAIGAHTGTLTLDLSSGDPLQFQSTASDATRAESITVRSSSLADAFDRLTLATCDLLKLDCEGAEYDILFNAPPNVLKRVRRIVMEYHDNATPQTHLDLERYLTQHGFRVEVFPNPVHAYLGYLRAEQIQPL